MGTSPFEEESQSVAHYSDVIMSAMASQITGVSIIYSTVCSGAYQRKHQSTASQAFVKELTVEFPAQRASSAENVSIWLRHPCLGFICMLYMY